MPLERAEATEILNTMVLPAFWVELRKLNRIDQWHRWDHPKPHSPQQSTREYDELSSRAQTPWLGLVVTAVAQALYVEGYRRADEPDNAQPWQWWQANGLDSRQIAVHRSALTYGQAYTLVLPGEDPITGEPMPIIRGISPRRMSAWWDDPSRDDHPRFAVEMSPAWVTTEAGRRRGYDVILYDDERVWRFQVGEGEGQQVKFITWDEHGIGICPVVRFANMLDLEGRADGEVEPFIPVAGRIDQTTFDRIVVQRFSSWVVRTISGMAKPESADDADAEKLRLKIEDILIAEDPDTKFGSLPATPLGGFIEAHDSDIRDLAAITQTPPHHLLGQIANLSAEALAAAEAGLSRKVEERKHSFGESWERTLRLSAWVMGDEEGAADTSAQVRWRDTESRSLAQTADALGKLAQMLGVPVEMLWEKIPGWTDQDVERAKVLVEQGGPLDALMRELTGGQTSAEPEEPEEPEEPSS